LNKQSFERRLFQEKNLKAGRKTSYKNFFNTELQRLVLLRH